MIKTDRASSNHYVLTVDTTRHRLANQKKKRYVGEKSISVDKIIRFWIKENRQFSVRHDCLLHKQYNSASCNKFYVFCLFILKSIFAQLYMLTPRYTRTSACNRETCSGRLKLNHNIHVRIYVICRCSIE